MIRKAILFFLLLVNTVIFASTPEAKNSTILLAPLSGTYTIPGDFASINAAANSLNVNGVSGPVLFNVVANHTETAPAGSSAALPGGIIFGNISGTSATNTITFQKSGAGANPLITAGANHFAGGIMDGVVKIIGTDYLIFDAIDVIENPLNTTFSPIGSNNMTEFGFAFFYANPIATANGAKNNIIRNCTITLNTTGTAYQNTFGVYSTCLTSAVDGLTLATITAVAGSNSNNRIVGNTINNANFGIVIVGSNTAAAMDSGWDIGGTTVATGNTINNFGIGNGVAASAYQKIGASVQGILVNQIANHNISYNTITSVAGTTTTPIIMAGIVMGSSGTSVQPPTHNTSCNFNSIQINNGLSESSVGIWSKLGDNASIKNINNNIINIVNTATVNVTAKLTRGIAHEASMGQLIISNNTVFIHYENVNNDHTLNFIQTDITTVNSRIITNNTLATPVGKSLRNSGNVNGISHSGNSFGILNISNNTIDITKGNSASTCNFFGINSTGVSASITYSISSNTISLNAISSTNSSTTIRGINNIDGSSTLNKTISLNTITINGNNTGGITSGIYLERTGIATVGQNAITINNYTSTIYGIFFTTGCTTNNASANTVVISPNNVSVALTIFGIRSSIGVANITTSDITISPVVTPNVAIALTLHGIYNTQANANISNTTKIEMNPLSVNPAFVVGLTCNGIFNSGSTSTISNNSGIAIGSNTASGLATTNGIINSGFGSTINGNTITLNVTGKLTTTINGISNTSSNVTLSNNNLDVALTIVTESGLAYGISNTFSGVTISNNTISAESTSLTTSRAYGVNNTGTTTSILNNPTVNANAISTGGNTFARGIYSSVTSTINNNTSINVNSQAANRVNIHGIYAFGAINNNTISLTCLSQLGIDNSAGIQADNTSTIQNNSVVTNLVTASSDCVAGGINNNGSDSVVSNNSVQVSAVSNGNQVALSWFAVIYGIRTKNANTTVANNTISGVYGSMGKGTTIFEIAGIILDAASNATISGNIIKNVSSNGTADNRTYLSGIYALTSSFNATIKNNRIFDISLNNNVTGTHPGPGFVTGQPVPANTNGIWIRMSFNTTLNDYKIYNNHISKLYNPSASTLGGIFGLALSSRDVNHLVYNNTILLGDNTTQITGNMTNSFGAAAVGYLNRVANGITDLRNNILYTNVLPIGNGYVAALAAIKNHDFDLGTAFTAPGQTGIRPPNYNPASNNNLFYAPSVHNRRSYFYCEGDGFGTEYNRFNIDHNTVAIHDPNINVIPAAGCTSKYKTLMNGGASNYGTDSNSFYDNVILTEGVGADEGYWTPSGETYAEMGAQVLPAEYDLDSKNISRGSTPDMGALQFSGEVDTVPAITYGPIIIPGSCGSVPTSLTLNNVRIVDTAGVPTSGSLMPRLYYKIDAGAYISVTGTLVSGTGTDGYWDFTMTGITPGIISYYVIAQDRLTKLISNPSAGLVACNVNTVTTHPTSPSTISISGSAAIYALGAWSTPPSITKAVIFDDDYTSVSNIEACSVLVKAGRTVTFNSAHTLLVQYEVVVEPGGNLIFENNSSLVQIENSANTGDINYKRTASVKKFDYVYWSSPVDAFNLDNLNSLLPTGPKYRWEPTTANGNGGIGNWEDAQSNVMETARGYIVRSPSSFSPTVVAPFTSTFIGVPNNGVISRTIARGPMTAATLGSYTSLNGVAFTPFDDNWNLIGNPYPSAISANQLLFENRETNGGVLAGFINIWRHGIDLQTGINNPFYGSYVYNYDPNDYLTYNILGASCCPAVGDYKIGAGQGFFVQMIEGTPATGTVIFNNTMRRDLTNLPHGNTTFYRTTETTTNLSNLERHRIWLDLVATNNSSQRILIGYMTGATNAFDSFYDVPAPNKNDLDVYSLIGNQHHKIESRALPFSSYDEVPVGFYAPENGNYTFAIAALDGLFENQNIYIKDLEDNSYHDLKSGPYSFNTTSGSHNNRFVVVYQNSVLDNNSFEAENTIQVYSSGKKIGIKSSQSLLEEVKIYDLSGRLLYLKSDIQSSEITLTDVTLSDQMLLIEIRTQNGLKTLKKIIN